MQQGFKMIWRVRKPALALGAAVLLWRLVRPRSTERRSAVADNAEQDFPDTVPAVWNDSAGWLVHGEAKGQAHVEV